MYGVLNYWSNIKILFISLTPSAVSSQFGGIPLNWVTGFRSWDLGDSFIFFTRPSGSYGLVISLDDRLWFMNITLHTAESFSGTPFRLVGNHWWWCMHIAKGLGLYPRFISRLACGLKTREIGCYAEHISCPGWLPELLKMAWALPVDPAWLFPWGVSCFS